MLAADNDFPGKGFRWAPFKLLSVGKCGGL